MRLQLEQALQVSEQDVKDASAGVLKDLKRFQLEKEDDLKRYMVIVPNPLVLLSLLTSVIRLHTLNATSIGRRRTSILGGKPRKRLIR